MPIAGVRPCGAKCRTKNGNPCMQPAMKDSNRCRMHFGHAKKLRTHGERRQQRVILNEMRALFKEVKHGCQTATHETVQRPRSVEPA